MNVNNVIDTILEKNRSFKRAETELNQLWKQYHIRPYINTLSDLLYIIDKLSINRTMVQQLRIHYILKYEQFTNEYLNAVAQLRLKPDREFHTIFNAVINNFDIIYKYLDNVAQSVYTEIWRAFSGRIGMYYSHISIPHDKCTFKNIPLQKSCLSYMQPYLEQLWNLYNTQIYKKCKRGPKMMFKFFLVFQEYFTDEMFNTLITRLTAYQDSFMIRYILEGSRISLNQERHDKAASMYSIIKLSQV